MKDKKVKSLAVAKITPDNIGGVSFSEHLTAYRLKLDKRNKLEEDLAKKKQSLAEYYNKQTLDKDQQIVVYKKVQKIKFSAQVKELVAEEGWAFEMLAGNGLCMETLEELLGKKAKELIFDCARAYKQRNSPEQEISQSETTRRRNIAKKQIEEIKDLERQLTDAVREVERVKEEVAFFKDLSDIASNRKALKGGE